MRHRGCGRLRFNNSGDRRSRKKCVNKTNQPIVDELARLQARLIEQDANSNLAHSYAKATSSICKCPLEMRSKEDLAQLKFVGPAITVCIEKFWQRESEKKSSPLQNRKNHASTTELVHNVKHKSIPSASAAIDEMPKPKPRNQSKQKSSKTYVPQFRSGGYAILIALGLEARNENVLCDAMRKQDIISRAIKFCDSSFHRTESSSYCAWNSINTLLSKDLVYTEGNPKCFGLTDTGLELAENIISKMDEIESDILSGSRVCGGTDSIHTRQPELNTITDIHQPHNIVSVDSSHYEVCLLIDNRERIDNDRQRIINYMSANTKMIVESVSLSIGDMLWVARRRGTLNTSWQDAIVLSPIIERKQISDLASSMKDGRYENQKYRLKLSNSLVVVYLIEGIMSSEFGIPEHTLQACIAETMTNDNFFVHHTADITMTLRFLVSMSNRVLNEFNCKGAPNNSLTLDELFVLTKKRQEIPTPIAFGQQLCCVNGVSVEKCESITSKYGSARALFEAYEQCDGVAEENVLLANLTFFSKGILEKRIGPAVSMRVRNFFRDTLYRSNARSNNLQRSDSANSHFTE